MFFNSLEFTLFLPFVFVVYWLLQRFSLTIQNGWILAASFFFYGWWDYRFLLLITISIFTDFWLGKAIHSSHHPTTRKRLLYLSLFINLGMLMFFKYFNFFIDTFREAFTFFGSGFTSPMLSIILPVGISFYTFQTLSYTIDVYNRKIEATRDILAFGAFVSFFPQLVAGPIERATHLLPQFQTKRNFEYESAAQGMRLILWGLFKKMVVADSCAVLVNQIFGSYEQQSGIVLILGAVLFSFQIYGDFSGYSDIAIGTARLFGIRLMRNFNVPYFSRDIAEFWRRWHISLTTWFRDYVYIPLGGSRIGRLTTIRNTLIIFLVSGFWHGANWTFIFWGLYHALLFVPLVLLNLNRRYLTETVGLKSAAELLRMGATFILVSLGWIFFRSLNIEDAFRYLSRIFTVSSDYFAFSTLFNGATTLSNYTLFFSVFSVFCLLVVEGFFSGKRQLFEIRTTSLRRLVYFLVCLFIYIARGGNEAFIYFQF